MLVRVVLAGRSPETHLLGPASPSLTVGAGDGHDTVIADYLRLGVEHILLGVDHLLFVLGLLLLIRRLRALLLAITAFTAAHSITLALSTLDIVRLPSAPVEAVIALSIVLLAAEYLRGRTDSMLSRRPWMVAFGFGLLHGFGFASVLAEIGLPADQVPLALLLFNVGVELGQLAFIAVSLLVIRRLCGLRWPLMLAAYVMGGWATCWLIERIQAF